jgi:hypothetical protein
MSKRLLNALDQLIALQQEQNLKLDKLTALLTSDQLLNECVDHHGNPRAPEECADIVIEGFSAALCLMGDLDQRNRDYQYQKQEFFIDDEDSDEDEEDDDDPRTNFVKSF